MKGLHDFCVSLSFGKNSLRTDLDTRFKAIENKKGGCLTPAPVINPK
jgi:hypothetical protein